MFKLVSCIIKGKLTRFSVSAPILSRKAEDIVVCNWWAIVAIQCIQSYRLSVDKSPETHHHYIATKCSFLYDRGQYFFGCLPDKACLAATGDQSTGSGMGQWMHFCQGELSLNIKQATLPMTSFIPDICENSTFSILLQMVSTVTNILKVVQPSIYVQR